MRYLILPIVAGLTACNPTAPPNDAAFCRPLFTQEVAQLEGALVANAAQTPEEVGDEATDVILAHRAGCAE